MSKKHRQITERERKLVDLKLAGKTLAKCYELSGYSCATWTDINKAAKALEVLKRPLVKEYLESQQGAVNKEIQKKIAWSRKKAVNTFVNIIDDDEMKDVHARISATRELNKMFGYDKPQLDDESNRPRFKISAENIARSFVDINRDITNKKYEEYWFEGGRGSTKSTFISDKIIELLDHNPNMCALVLRRVSNTLGTSVFSDLQNSISRAGLSNYYRVTKSPMQILNLQTGQIIYFKGGDDSKKVKSIRPPDGKYIGIHWFEEFDQFQGMNTVREIELSLLRGGDTYYRFKSYNTPQSVQHFVNKEKLLPKEGRVIHKSTYLDVPQEWLGKPFFAEAEYLKEVNEEAYLNDLLGEMTGEGGLVFNNLEIRDIEPEEFETFGTEYQGLDFGCTIDPNHWSQCFYNVAQRMLYITDEWRSTHMSNNMIFEALQEKGVLKPHVELIVDSAESKSVIDLKQYPDLFVSGAKKPPGSVRQGIKWLSTLRKIVIDSKCRHTIKEFTEYELLKDKDGNYISQFSEFNNHSIDSVRYALNRIWLESGA